MSAVQISDSFQDLRKSLDALLAADAAGTTTVQHLVDVWWAVAPVRPHLPDRSGYLLTTVIEARLPAETLDELRIHIYDLVSRRIAEAHGQGLPVFELGGIVGLAEADNAIAAAQAGDRR